MRNSLLSAAGLLLLGASLQAQTQACRKVVSFAMADANGVHPFMGTGNWIGKWVEKNAKRYPSICFSQSPIQGRANFLVVLSQSTGYLSGFDPVIRTDTNTSTTPVSGSGTVTSNYGGTWNYTYNGTATTTTTTTTQENVPYTISSRTVYAYAYGDGGAIISQRYHTYSSKSGGDAANSAGYNIGSALAAINARGRLVGSVVKDIQGQPDIVPVQQISQPSAPVASVALVQPSQLPASAGSSCKPYANTGEKESITENADGKILILSDGSIWQVLEIDTIEASLWLPVDDVVVVRAENPIACFNYTLIDTDEQVKKARAQYLGQK